MTPAPNAPVAPGDAALAGHGSRSAGPVQISVIVPTLDEAENVDQLLDALLRAFSGHSQAFEILIADGGSTDGTLERVAAWSARWPVRLLSPQSGRGLAGDVLAAAAVAVGEVLVVMDADLSHPPAVAPELARAVLLGDCDLALGSRHVKGGGTPGWPWNRRLSSRVATWLAWPVTDVRDPLAGFFALRREELRHVDPEVAGFKLALEILVRRAGQLRVRELPITFVDRKRGTSKFGARQVLAYLQRLLALMGATARGSNALRFGLVGLLGMAVDLGAFAALQAAGLALAPAHIASFWIATVHNYAWNERWTFRIGTHAPLRVARYLRFLVLCLLALFLRGGVLQLLTGELGWPALAGVTGGTLAAALVNFVGSAFFLFTDERGTPAVVRWRVGASALVAYALLLRLLYLGAPDLLPEEAYYWNYAQHPALGYLDHPPLIAWLIGAGTALLGHGELGVRSGALLCWAIAAWFSYGLARNLYDKTTGILALLLVSTLPYFACAGFVATPDAPLLAAWAGALYFLERATRAGHARAWLGFGACLGLGLLSKYTIVLVGAASLVYLLGEPRTRRWLTRPEPCAGLLLGLFLFSPVVLWNYRNDWASFAFQTVRRTSAASRFSLPALVLDMALLLTPAGLLGAGSALAGRPSAEQAEERSRWRFQATLTLVPLLVFCLFSLTHRPRLNWTGPVWLAVLPLLAHRLPGLLSGSRSWLRSLERRLWKPAIAGSLLALGAGLHFLALGLPGLDFDDVRLDKAPVAWEEIGAAVDQIAEQIEQGPGQALVVGMDKYSTASELAFYRSASTAVESTTSNHLFGSSGLMYRFWQKEPPQEERPLLLVSLDPEELRDERIFRHLNEVGSIEELAILKGDAHAGTLYYRLCRGYAPSLR